MRTFKFVLALAVASPGPAFACRDEPELKLSWLKIADLVVVAQVSNYRAVPDFNDPIAAAHHYELLEQALVAPPEQRERIKQQLRPAFARIDVKVGEVLAGTLPEALEVTWDTNLFKLPENLKAGSYLLALHAPGKYETTRARTKTWTVLSPICDLSFLVPSDSKEAGAIRAYLLNASNRSAVGAQEK